MKLLLLVITLLSVTYNFGQTSTTTKYTRIIINDSISKEQALQISNHFREFQDVRISRLDRTSHVYTAVYDLSDNVYDDLFRLWIENQGYTIKCSYTDFYEEGKMVELSIKTCK